VDGGVEGADGGDGDVAVPEASGSVTAGGAGVDDATGVSEPDVAAATEAGADASVVVSAVVASPVVVSAMLAAGATVDGVASSARADPTANSAATIVTRRTSQSFVRSTSCIR
jgi:hypothetical protein